MVTCWERADLFVLVLMLKGIDYCPIELIKGLTDKGLFQYLTNLRRPQVGNYLYSFTKIKINILS